MPPFPRPEKIDVHIPEGTSTLLIGEAPPHQVREGIKILADISAPYEFYRHNSKGLDLSQCYLAVSYDDGSIVLHVDVYYLQDRSEISGRLQQHTKLDMLGKWYSPSELAQIIKTNRRMIPVDATITWEKLYTHLSKFKGEVKRIIETEEDGRGNNRDVMEQVFQTEVPTSFVMEAALYAGGNDQKAKFDVDIEIDVRDRGVSLRLMSVELLEIMADQNKKLIDAQVAKFEDAIPVYYLRR